MQTIRELRGISEQEFGAAVEAARRLFAAGEDKAGLEVLTGLVLYDPFCREVWLELEAFCRRRRESEAAELFAGMVRALSA